MVPGHVTGSRAGDDARLRRRLVLAARVATVVAGVILIVGLLLAARDDRAARAARDADDGSTQAVAQPPKPIAVPVRVSPNGTATSPVAWQIRRIGDRARTDAIAAYKAYFGTSVRLGEEPDPADPALPQVAVDPELGRLRRALSVHNDAQLTRRGRILVVARVDSLRGRQAVVVACANWSRQRQYDVAGRPGSWRAGITASVAELRWLDGGWKVYRVNPAPMSRCRR